MNVNNFKDQFSQLLLQYSLLNPARNNSTPEIQGLLTHQEILDAVREVLHTRLNINFQDINVADWKTPANEIVITTPNAPDIAKHKYDPNDGLPIRDQSLKSNMSLRIDTSDMDTFEIDTTPIADNSKSTSNDSSQQDRPSMGTMEIAVTEEQRHFREVLQSKLSSLAESQKNAIHKTIEEARKGALTVLDKIEDIRDLLDPELKPNRRLSSMLELPGPKSQSTDGPSANLRVSQRRSIQAARRSISSQQKRSDTSLTPTSRLSSIRAPPCSPSDSGVSASKIKAVEKLDARSRSISMSSLLPKSPTKLKNPKYAHIQSTIPKPTVTLKRKAT